MWTGEDQADLAPRGLVIVLGHAREDPRTVTTGPDARYFGTAIGDTLVPAGEARIGATRFEDRLKA